MGSSNPQLARQRRHRRVRTRLCGTPDRLRLCVFRSLNHIYAQVIDDTTGKTVASASTIDPEIRSDVLNKTKTEQAKLVGSLVAKRAQGKGVENVVFDRGGCKYHGRIKCLADAAREAGLRF